MERKKSARFGDDWKWSLRRILAHSPVSDQWLFTRLRSGCTGVGFSGGGGAQRATLKGRKVENSHVTKTPKVFRSSARQQAAKCQ